MTLARLSLPFAALLALSSFLLTPACGDSDSGDAGPSSSGGTSSQGGSGGSGTAGSGGSGTAGSGTAGSGTAGSDAGGSGGSGQAGSSTAGQGGSEAGSGGSEAGAGGSEAAGSGGSDAAGAGGSDAGGSGGSGQAGSGGAPESCAAIGATDCFSNYDCNADERCEALVSEVVICCTKGPRGTGKAGEVCKGEADCKSALCIDSDKVGVVCTDKCTTEADCPEGMKQCIPIAFSGSADLFCAPSSN